MKLKAVFDDRLEDRLNLWSCLIFVDDNERYNYAEMAESIVFDKLEKPISDKTIGVRRMRVFIKENLLKERYDT